jgi:peptidoglycan/xylan/chitin deacetylase (PgdA/CDA1 family)
MLIGLFAVVSFVDLSSTFISVEAPVYSGKSETKSVAFMFNVYENEETVREIMKVLEENNASATFFVGGKWAKDNLSTVIEIGKKFELGNHGYSHAELAISNVEKITQELSATHKIVKGATGIEMKLFAPPSGHFNKTTLSVAEKLGYTTVMWTQGKDTIDWRDHDKDLIIKRATRDAKNGDLILMHPTAETLEALPDIINFYTNNKFSMEKVSEII